MSEKLMTFEELERIVQSLIEGLAEQNAEQKAEHERQKAEHERQKAELERQKAEQKAEHERQKAEQKAEHERQKAEHEKWLAEQKKRDAQAAREMKELRQQIGGVGKSQGAHAEQFFHRAMLRRKSFCGIDYDLVHANISSHKDGVSEEYDILLQNGKKTIVIEVKYKFQMHDLKTFVNRKMANFRKLCSKFAAEEVYTAIAGFSFEEGVVDEAKKMGVAVIQKDGKNIEIESEGLHMF